MSPMCQVDPFFPIITSAVFTGMSVSNLAPEGIILICCFWVEFSKAHKWFKNTKFIDLCTPKLLRHSWRILPCDLSIYLIKRLLQVKATALLTFKDIQGSNLSYVSYHSNSKVLLLLVLFFFLIQLSPSG